MNNTIKTITLLGVLSLLLIYIGGIIGGENGTMMAFLFALTMNGIAYFFSDKIALASSGAKPVSVSQAPEIYNMVQRLTKKAGIPMPKIFLIPTNQANAFATGRDPQHASMAVTQGLINNLSPDEVEGVIAHELSHIKNRDILITSIAAVLASSISFLANMGWYMGGARSSNDENRNHGSPLGLLLVVLAPIAGSILQLAVSREREFEADRSGATLMGTGHPLADALTNIDRSTKMLPQGDLNPAFSSLYIANPLGGLGGSMMSLFSTHPSTAERVKRLRSLRL